MKIKYKNIIYGKIFKNKLSTQSNKYLDSFVCRLH